MKMIYPQRNNNQRRSTNTFLIPVCIALVLALFCAACLYLAPRVTNRFAVVFARPMWTLRSSVGNNFAYVGTFFSSHRALVDKNNNLQAELDTEKADVLSYDALLDQYQKLLQAFGRDTTHTRTLALFRFLSHIHTHTHSLSLSLTLLH